VTTDTDTFEPALAHTDPRHMGAAHFLVEEAALLDARRWHAWLALLTADVRYTMPVRVTTSRAAELRRCGEMSHFDEDHYSLSKRVERLTTEYAWTEDPPSRTRHLVTNIRTFGTDSDDTLRVESALLLFRSRGDTRPPEIVCAGRVDRLRATDGGYRLAERRIDVDEAVLRTQNLAIFL
jgi:3-phenylpropionate/cinnamic acid dioxygenase small subunit